MSFLWGRLRKNSAGFTENLTEMLAAQADRRRINDWHHLFDIARQQAIKENSLVSCNPRKNVYFIMSV